MITYLLNILFLTFFGIFIIYSYYTTGNGMHIENFDGYFIYILIIGIIYGIYKYIQLNSTKDNKISFSPLAIFNYFLGHLFILCLLFFIFNNQNISGGFLLFLKILGYCFFPLSIIFISYGFGTKIVNLLSTKINNNYIFNNLIDNKTFCFLTSLGIGFFSFLFILTIIGIFGLYNIWIVILILVLFLLFSYKQLSSIILGLYDKKFEFDLKQGNGLYLISSEFFFLIITLVLSISLINIARPFPIGWDDLGVYMNYPKLMAQSGKIISLGGMFSWQTFTGIGYMLNSATQAFYFNVVGGFLSVIVLVSIISDLFKSFLTKKTFFNIAMFVGMFFISMPMIVFQQAKDMKLDSGLFFVSIISLYLLFKYLLFYINDKNILEKGIDKILHHDKFDNGNIIFLLIIGLLAGFAFSIKFTSLILISAMIGLLFYSRLGLIGFFAYVSSYFGIFTKANLWKYMNVVVNPNNVIGFENKFFYISIFISILLLTYIILKNKQKFILFLKEIGVFIIGILIALSPWIGKNIYESYPNISLGSIISGKSESYIFDKTKIYNQSEIDEIEEFKRERTTSSGTSTNEDFGRYIGYEKGINNYVKLPWNLTMQLNQRGEFTDIGYIYLLFIPFIFIFLNFRKKIYILGIYLILLFELLLFSFLPFTTFMSGLYLPFGYIFLFLFLLIPFLYLYFTLSKSKENNLFKINLIFSLFYVFLWLISSFGIVWYGIVMYFSFLLMIALGLYNISFFEKQDNSKDYFIKMFCSIIILFLALIYILFSVIPHSLTNLKTASYLEFKVGKINSIEAPFLYQSDYMNTLFELNIADEKKQEFISNFINDETLIKIINQNKINNISDITILLRQIINNKDIPLVVKSNARISLNNIYFGISNPKGDFKNQNIIYRIGTFLKYHISENNKRLLEDSLIFKFSDFIYNDDSKITVSRLKDLGVKYLLVDLNAATIDRDYKNHFLTNRYEELLKTFLDDDLILVDSDSKCLKMGLSDYSINNDVERYMTLAGVNYESFDENNKIINRKNKLEVCYSYIVELLKNDLISDDNFSYLKDINYEVKSNSGILNTDDNIIKYLNSKSLSGRFALFKIK